MGLATWWKESRLKAIERKLRTLRGLQRHVREQETQLAEQRRKGALSPSQAAAREAKLKLEMDRLTHQIRDLQAREEALKTELRATDAAPA